MYIKQRPEQLVTIYDSSKAYNGYTMFAPHASTDVWLIDMKGRVVHHWELPTFLGSDVRLLPNGNQIRVHKTGTEPTAFLGTGGKELVEVDWQGNVVWKYDDLYMHHDFCRLENGNTLLNRYVQVPNEMAAKVKGGIPGTELEDGMWGAGFQEMRRETVTQRVHTHTLGNARFAAGLLEELPGRGEIIAFVLGRPRKQERFWTLGTPILTQ